MKMSEKEELSREKQIRLMEISFTPAFVLLLATVLYLGYLRATGTEVSDFFFWNSLLSVILISLAASLTLNEVLVKKNGGKFRIRRLVFRWIMMASYFVLFLAIYTVFSTLLQPMEVAVAPIFSLLLASGIYVVVLYKGRRLFGRLDRL
jgi:hypothetical protein